VSLLSKEERYHGGAGLCFTIAAFLGFAFTFVYWYNDSLRLEGTFLGVCLVFLAIGLVLWSRQLPEGPFEETYPELQSTPEKEAETLATIDRGWVGRRKFLLGALGLAGGSILAGAASAIRSLGPGPYTLASTEWRGGKQLVNLDGDPVHISDVPPNTFVVVAPAGFTDTPMVQAVLIHLPRDAAASAHGDYEADGFVCFSRVCTHAGCAVGQYNAQTVQLQCPCHQSTFDVLDGAKPVFGPADRALPRLPITVDPDGTVRSTGDFTTPVGPTFWHRT
jgi:ubiquinol-cytochrome c reductase iron-sulfur subunit